MNYYVYLTDIMKDVSKVVDYLEVGSPHHVRSYFWWGGDRNRKNSFKLLPFGSGIFKGIASCASG